jgi:hypothetical protein
MKALHFHSHVAPLSRLIQSPFGHGFMVTKDGISVAELATRAQKRFLAIGDGLIRPQIALRFASRLLSATLVRYLRRNLCLAYRDSLSELSLHLTVRPGEGYCRD